MKKDLITKFREFHNNLNIVEQKHLWDIMTALRGNDEMFDLEDEEKCLTTARIRGELFGKTGWDSGIGGYSYPSYFTVPSFAKEKVQRVSKKFTPFSTHFVVHVRSAIRALNNYRPKKAMRDLQKFIV